MTYRRYHTNARPMDFHRLHKEQPLWRHPVVSGALIGAALGTLSALVWALF